MSQKANYFKLGLFVIGGVVAGVARARSSSAPAAGSSAGSSIETYFNESVQGLDIGSKLKYRGVIIGEVTRISFTYTKYQQDLPITAARALRAGRGADPAAPGRRPRGGGRHDRPGEREDGGRAGLAHAARAAGDHRHELPRDRLRRAAAAACCRSTGCRTNVYIPSAPSTVTAIVNAASDIIERLHKRRHRGRRSRNLDRLLDTDQRAARGGRRQGAVGPRAERRSPSSTARSTTCTRRSCRDEGDRAARRAARDERRAQEDARESGVAEAARGRGGGGGARARARVRPQAQQTIGEPRAHHSRRFDRILGGGDSDLATTIEQPARRSPTTCATSPRTRNAIRRT